MMGVRQAVAVVLAALLVGLLTGYLMWERPRQSALRELEDLKARQADLASRAQTERKQLTEELNSERERRRGLEEILSRGRK